MTIVPPSADTPTVAPEDPHLERLRSAVAARGRTDAAFHPERAVVLTVITLGLYGFACLSQLLARSGGHLRRRVDVLDAATVLAWERAQTRGLADELRPAFERTVVALDRVRAMTADFRDPGIWLTLAIVATVVTWVGGLVAAILAFVFLDADVVKHQRAERAVTAELRAIFLRLGLVLPDDSKTPVKRPQRCVPRIVASILTFGLYLLWWMHDLMVDANHHVASEWPLEDALVSALATGT